MYGRAIIAPLSFGDSTLPKIEIDYVRPLNNALYDWAVDNLPDGPLTSWPSLIDGTALIGDGNLPVVSGTGTSKIISLDGVSGRLRKAFSVTGPYTMAVVFRLTAPAANQTIDYGYIDSTVPRMTVSGAATSFNVTNGSQFMVPSPLVAPNTAWHVAVYTVNGSSQSGLNIDGQDAVGTMTNVGRDGLTLGYAAGNGRVPIEYKRVAILSGGTTAVERNALVATLEAQYGL